MQLGRCETQLEGCEESSMSEEKWERRFICAITIAIYIHVTQNIWGGFFSIFGIAMCVGLCVCARLVQRSCRSRLTV